MAVGKICTHTLCFQSVQIPSTSEDHPSEFDNPANWEDCNQQSENPVLCNIQNLSLNLRIPSSFSFLLRKQQLQGTKINVIEIIEHILEEAF